MFHQLNYNIRLKSISILMIFIVLCYSYVFAEPTKITTATTTPSPPTQTSQNTPSKTTTTTTAQIQSPSSSPPPQTPLVTNTLTTPDALSHLPSEKISSTTPSNPPEPVHEETQHQHEMSEEEEETNEAEPFMFRHSSSRLEPLFTKFLHNQRRGFPFPDGQECEEDAHKLCAGILKRCVGDYGCTTQCLTDHAPALSPKCAQAHPCYSAIDQFCPHVAPAQNEMMRCLQSHLSELPEACLQAHPCLKSDDLNQECQVLDYSGKAPAFLTNLRHFLDTVRTGRIFNPFRRMFQFNNNQQNLPDDPVLEKENELIAREQHQLHVERAELEREKRELMTLEKKNKDFLGTNGLKDVVSHDSKNNDNNNNNSHRPAIMPDQYNPSLMNKATAKVTSTNANSNSNTNTNAHTAAATHVHTANMFHLFVLFAAALIASLAWL